MPRETALRYPSLSALLSSGSLRAADGPLAVVLVEDAVEVASTLRHHLGLGFRTVLALMPDVFDLPDDLGPRVCRVDYDPTVDHGMTQAINAIIEAACGRWIFYCFNAEYLFFPFCETRSVGEMLAFHAEERRAAMLAYVIDLYADDLGRFPYAVSLEHAHLDRAGYYARPRKDASRDDAVLDRQVDVFGGLRWRFEEHVPWDRRRIDRIALFKAARGVQLGADHTFNVAEYNTYACAWHNNLTAAVCSFRAAKALRMNPSSSDSIATFTWRNSQKFEWHSQQLLDLGLIEPGQWF
jgi:hypothetical protein